MFGTKESLAMNSYYSNLKVNNPVCCRFVLDPDNRVIVNADANFQHIFRYSYIEIAEKNDFSGYVHEDDYRPLMQSIKAQIADGNRMCAANYRIITKQGEIYGASFSGCVFYENGVTLIECILFNLCLLRDGENIRPNASDSDIFKKTISVFENMSVGFFMAGILLNKDKKPYDIIIDYINNSAAELLRAEKRLVVGKKCFYELGETDEKIL
ncbi:MAG: PAS domain-containing protein, partial [Oscillospiraceae bacterium]|nr:PAS domain-containing protein [Oscillospiraceae bacterium]